MAPKTPTLMVDFSSNESQVVLFMGIGNKEPRGLWYVSHSISRQTTLIIAKSG